MDNLTIKLHVTPNLRSELEEISTSIHKTHFKDMKNTALLGLFSSIFIFTLYIIFSDSDLSKWPLILSIVLVILSSAILIFDKFVFTRILLSSLSTVEGKHLQYIFTPNQLKFTNLSTGNVLFFNPQQCRVLFENESIILIIVHTPKIRNLFCVDKRQLDSAQIIQLKNFISFYIKQIN